MIGTMKETMDGISGQIRTYSMNEEFRLVPVKDRQSQNAPTHTIIMKGRHGHDFDAGVAFSNHSLKVGQYYSLFFSVPELFDGEFRCVAWANRNEQGVFDIAVSKDKERELEKQAA